MNSVADVHDAVDVIARRCSDPLFIQSRTLLGRDEHTPNGTATLVQIDGAVYVVTCRHVAGYPASIGDPHVTCALMADKMVLNLSEITAEGVRSSFGEVAADFSDRERDIAILPLAEHLWKHYGARKAKRPLNLDAWREPPWADIKWCAVAGYPTYHKQVQGDQLASPMVVSIVETAGGIDPENASFTLSSQLPEPSPYYFSGISGGPVFGLTDDEIWPVGIVYEGHPSTPADARPAEAFLGPTDLFFRGLLLTPCIFRRWIESRRQCKALPIDWEAILRKEGR